MFTTTQKGGFGLKPFNSSLLLSSIIIGASFITGCFFIQKAFIPEKTAAPNEEATDPKPLMNIKETAEYLNLTVPQVITIIGYENHSLNLANSYVGKMFPYIKINNEIFVSRGELDGWIIDSTVNRKEHMTNP